MYPDELCRKVCKGLLKQMEMDGRIKEDQRGIAQAEEDKPTQVAKTEIDDDLSHSKEANCGKCGWKGLPHVPGFCPSCGRRGHIEWPKREGRKKINKEGSTNYVSYDQNGNKVYYVDTTGTKLPTELVIEARKEEKKHVDHHEVYEECDIEEAIRITGKPPIATKWIDVNKGNEKNFEVRCRWVAKQPKIHATEKSPFAATPPLETQKLLFSLAVTDGYGCDINNSKKGSKLDFIDIRRAFFMPRHKGLFTCNYRKSGPHQENVED